MSGLFSRGSLNFLYRNDQGEVSRAVWWSGLVPLASLLLVLTIIWLLIAPWGQRGLNERAFVDVRTIVSYTYLLFYTLAVILIAVSYTNLSAKRFRARGRMAGFAGLLPLAALLAGAAHWLYPRVPQSMPYWSLVTADIALVGVLLWHVIDLGLSPDK